MSAGLLANVKGYRQALTFYREADPDAIIEQCSEAAFLAIENGTALADDVSTITNSWREKITARSDAGVWKVLDLLAGQPAVNAATIRGRLGLDYMRSKRAMDSLGSAGIVVGVDKFKQGRFWRAPEMIEGLDAFAERAGRRTKSQVMAHNSR